MSGRSDSDGAASASDPPAADADPWLGRLVAGRYRVERVLGAGAMGVVYEVTHVGIDRPRALKALRAEHAQRSAVVARLVREARLASDLAERLDVAGVVRIHDVDQFEGRWFLVMDRLQGRTLESRLEDEGALSVEEAIRLTDELLAALGPVHANGIVHRDLKPENLFLVRDAAGVEHVRVLDFGIAAIVRDDAERLTGTHEVLGTPLYMSPEQGRGAMLADARSDLYAAGAILFELLTGEPSVSTTPTDTGMSVVVRICMGEGVRRRPRSLRGDLPVWLDDVVARALAQDRAERYPDAATFRDALRLQGHAPAARDDDPALQDTVLAPVPESPPRGADAEKPRRSRPLPRVTAWLSACAVVMLAAGSALWHRRARPAPLPPLGMVLEPGGEFVMGSTDEEVRENTAACTTLSPAAECDADVQLRESPAHRVRLSPYFMDATEVSTGDFASWLRSVPGLRLQPAERPGDHARFADAEGALVVLVERDDQGYRAGLAARDGLPSVLPGWRGRPVVLVPWRAARLYCASRGARLPTEAEWEFAARGTSRRRFPTADGAMSSDNRTPEGVFQLAEGVSEWTLDAFARYQGCAGACDDPRVEAGPDGRRVVRGGSWRLVGDARRGAARSARLPDAPTDDIGFRCVRELR